MATWTTVKEYLVSNYNVTEIDAYTFKLVFTLPNGRSHVVIAEGARQGDEVEPSWLDFQAPIGDIGEIQLFPAIRLASQGMVGGISLMGDSLVTLRGSVPLQNLDRNEIEQPMHLLCLQADRIEKALTGKDEY